VDRAAGVLLTALKIVNFGKVFTVQKAFVPVMYDIVSDATR
jgi:hypothetical protein